MLPFTTPVEFAEDDISGRSLKRLQFELALDLSFVGERSVAETLKRAADTTGAEILFVLPAVNGAEMKAVVRFNDAGNDYFLQVASVDAGFRVADEGEMDQALLGFARASTDVLRRMSSDSSIREPLTAT